MNLTVADAEELVSELHAKRCSGADDLELITWLCNRFRIPKSESRALYDDFIIGFQRGADSVIPFIDGKVDEPVGPDSEGTIFCAAYCLGQRSFTEEFARSLKRNRPRGCLRSLLFGILLSILAFVLCVEIL